MGSRTTSIKLLDYCYHPLKLLKDGEFIYVPCGKCDGCLLHKCNSWSKRLAFEIENNPFSIFITLTYDNYYLPTLILSKDDEDLFSTHYYFSDHSRNIRFNGIQDVLRDDRIIIKGSSKPFFVSITDDARVHTVNYASKRDIQLYLKLLRKSINENLNDTEFDNLRYYWISEIGPTTHRCHFHGLLFPRTRQIAELLMDSALFENWQMCDKSLLQDYLKYCNCQTAGYVTNYVTPGHKLPAIYQDPSIKPFRLSSKSPAIGYGSFDPSEIYQKLDQGIITYTRSKSYVDQPAVLEYPPAYMRTLFPKCYRFAELSFSRLLEVYGIIFQEVRGCRRPYFLLSRRLRKDMHSSDFQAAKACFDFCEKYDSVPVRYLFLLDMYYYKAAMSALYMWYSWQEKNCQDKVLILSSYNNLGDYVCSRSSLSSYQISRIQLFLDDFGICFDDLSLSDIDKLSYSSPVFDSYVGQVSDILSKMVKSKKVNDVLHKSPSF